MDMLKIEKIHYEIGGADIIESISFDARKNEFVSIIGPSGCGKSTLLRIIAGLIKPTGGDVICMNKRIEEPVREISFVFQDFALLPWLTNIDNVKLGLSYFDIGAPEKDKIAMELLARFGLEGFEYAYPNVLSGGMKQRVGFARAIAQEPSILLMDEPFSSLDELTATTMREDVLNMLKTKDIPVNLVVMVTHNVEEAVQLSDRVVVLSNKPTHVKQIKAVPLKQPRNTRSKEFTGIIDEIYATLTG
jgi:NitT/TauT family transport system ATP-binding protein